MKTFKRFKVVPATGFILWVLNKFGWTGWTSVWGRIYIRPDQLQNTVLINHEQVHARQIQEDGWYWQPIKYLYWTIKYGYKDNPYEVEARKLSSWKK